MKTLKHVILTGNQAVAHIAYKTNEVFPIYPITPASEMSELVEEWSACEEFNIFGDIPNTFEMQSEAGVAGAMHGALQTGSLCSTFTASQGLLLMAPNMYKMAGELTPHVIHVATRSIATHALSVFGDHSDIMAVRATGYAFLGAASVQETMDFALISQVATLESRIPFVHFFDGFRTSHETAKIEVVSDFIIDSMMNFDHIKAHRNRALNPNDPVIRGTSQTSDVFFQCREARNPYYEKCPSIVQNVMDRFYRLTGRRYNLFDYVGHQEAEQIIVVMASAAETVEETIHYLNLNGEKVGLIKVRLFRPFSAKHLLDALPSSCTAIAILDRTKEPGSSGEPLYLDVLEGLLHSNTRRKLPRIIGGRYGLSSKEFTPSMAKSIIDNLKKDNPKNKFTIGIRDDVSFTSLKVESKLELKDSNYQAIFYETKSNNTDVNFKELMRLLGQTPNTFIQGFTECDYNKARSTGASHLRIALDTIKAPYLITNADFIACDHNAFFAENDILKNIMDTGTVLVKTHFDEADFWINIPIEKYRIIEEKNLVLYIVSETFMMNRIKVLDDSISCLHACFLSFQHYTIEGLSLSEIQDNIKKLTKLDVTINKETLATNKEYSKSLLGKLLAGKGQELPVSLLPIDGTFPTDTSKYRAKIVPAQLPIWDVNRCTQCGACSMACPQGSLRVKAYDQRYLENAPFTFQNMEFQDVDWELDLLHYTIQVNPNQCNSCNNCVDACPANSLSLKKDVNISEVKQNWDHFETIPEFDRARINISKISQQQLQEPLFKYPAAVEGCGEAPYLKLLSQLFGNRMMVANATGASSIFGGALPTTPWAKNKEGHGPTWANSLFEDNAEFGLGYRLSLDQQELQAKGLLVSLMGAVDFSLINEIIHAEQNCEKEISIQQQRVANLKVILESLDTIQAKQLITVVDSLVKKSVWIVGGDGWAYDIGFGGLDHVLSSGKNINVLVLDNEVYDNTGGQMSKATPFAASAKFASGGKQKQKKDLGLMAMTYEDVYVASIAIGASQEQTLKAFVEAESYDGPSIIIAYCHSESHGIDMKNPSQYHKAAVDSCQWLLYRNDPRRALRQLNPFQLDSKEPSLKIGEYLKLENRFTELFDSHQNDSEVLLTRLQDHVDKRYACYSKRALPPIIKDLKTKNVLETRIDL